MKDTYLDVHCSIRLLYKWIAYYLVAKQILLEVPIDIQELSHAKKKKKGLGTRTRLHENLRKNGGFDSPLHNSHDMISHDYCQRQMTN